MTKAALVIACLMLLASPATQAASKSHTVGLGKPRMVKLLAGDNETKPVDMRVRPLYVDGKLKEYTTGDAHDLTERQFAVQRSFRINDALPNDRPGTPKWRWQRGGWLLVDRISGRVTHLRLPDFDATSSEVAWYRDYAAYCGTSDTGEKLYAVVTQVGERKPVLRKLIGTAAGSALATCGQPVWQRKPARVTFELKPDQKLTFTIHGRSAGPTATEAEDEESN